MKKISAFLFLFFAFLNSWAQWAPANVGLTDLTVYSIASDSINIYAGTSGSGVFVSNDKGANWHPSNAGITPSGPPIQVFTIVINGTSIYIGTCSGVFLSTDNANSWSPLNVGMETLCVRSIAFDGTNIFAGTDANGVFLSTNNGASWSPINAGLTATQVQALAISDTAVFAGTNGGGEIFLSSNLGATWTEINPGLAFGVGHSIKIIDTTVFLGTVSGVYASVDNGNSWVWKGMYLVTRSLAFNGSVLYAGGVGTSCNLYLSADLGSVWLCGGSGLPSDIINSIALDSTNLYVALNGSGVWVRPLSQLTGINEYKNKPSFTILPNPVVSFSEILFDEEQKDVTIKIVDVLGKEVRKMIFTGNRLLIERGGLGAGVYFISVFDEKKNVSHRKIVVQ